MIKISKFTPVLFLALVLVIIFAPFLKNGFSWDDKYLVLKNPYVKNWSYLPELFKTQLYEGAGIHSNFYRPFQTVSYMMDYSIWKLNPFGYHLTSLFLHIFNSILIYLILMGMSSQPLLSFLVAIFFGISPTISGITFYISARSDLLMTLFILTSFLFFVRYEKNKKIACYALSIISFAFALLSKEMAIVLLALLVLEIFRSALKMRKAAILILPYLLVLSVYVILRFTVLNFARGTNTFIDFSYPASIPLWQRILTAFKTIPNYLSILLFPYNLHMEWFIKPIKTLFRAEPWVYMFIFVILVFFIRRLNRVNKLAGFGILWFLLGLLPVLNIYPISVFFGEGWLYLPSVGFFIILSIFFQDFIRRKKNLGVSALILFILYYSFFTISYGKVWKDSISLFRNVLKYEENSPFIHLTYNNLAMAYYDAGDMDSSIEYCKKSIHSNPDYAEAYNNLGVAYVAESRPIKAIFFFKKAIGLKKDYVSAYCNLAHAYKTIELNDRALVFLKSALRIEPSSYEVNCGLGYIFSAKEDIDKAIYCFQEASRIRSDSFEPHYCLGSLYIKRNLFKEALDEYHNALQHGAGDHAFYNDLAFLYIKNNRFNEAEASYRKSLELYPGQSEPHNNLGNLYAMFGHFDLAIQEYKKAFNLEPHNSEIRNNIIKTKNEWKAFIRAGWIKS